MMGAGWQDHDLVFCWPDGSPIHPEHVSKQFARHSAKAGLRRIRLHDLRHGWGTHAIASGLDAATVSQRLGHGSVSFTMDTYVHALNDAETRAAKVASVLLGN